MNVSWKSQNSASKCVILQFLAIFAVFDVFDRFLLLCDKSQASSGSINPFYTSKASIWAQAQLSSFICLEDMGKTMASITAIMQKKTTFIIASTHLFFKCPGWTIFQWLGLDFTMELRVENHWETLSTLIFTWGLGKRLDHKILTLNQLQIRDWQRRAEAVRLAIC